MTKEAIIAEAKKLPRDEQHKIVDALSDGDGDNAELTPEDIAVVEARVKHAEEHPETVMSEEQFWSSVDSLTKQ